MLEDESVPTFGHCAHACLTTWYAQRGDEEVEEQNVAVLIINNLFSHNWLCINIWHWW